MQVRRHEPVADDAWDTFVATSLNGTFMQTRRFLSYHPADRFVDHSVSIWSDRASLRAVFPAAEVTSDGQRVWQSHPGASHGGLIVAAGLGTREIDAIVAALLEYAVQQQFSGIRWRSCERVFWRRDRDEIDAALFRAGFVLEGRELSTAVRLTPHSEDPHWTPLDQFADHARRHVRKAQREGIDVRVTDDFAGYWRLLADNLSLKHRTRPTHSLPEILCLKQLFGNRIELWGGFLKHELMAGIVLFQLNDQAAHVMYMAQDYAHQQLRSLNLVIHDTLAACARRGLKYVNFGISTEPGTHGRILNHGLHSFKRSCGGEAACRDLWFCDVQPLRRKPVT